MYKILIYAVYLIVYADKSEYMQKRACFAMKAARYFTLVFLFLQRRRKRFYKLTHMLWGFLSLFLHYPYNSAAHNNAVAVGGHFCSLFGG